VKEWLILAVAVIDWLALILIVVGAVEAFFQGLWTMFASRDGHLERGLGEIRQRQSSPGADP